MKMKWLITTSAVGILLCIAVSAIHAVRIHGAQLGFIGFLVDHSFPGFISPESWMQNLDLPDYRRYDAYQALGRSKSPIAVDRAIRDLRSDDDYLWLNAAIYLGHLNRVEAVPYLIKALRHTASYSDDERVALLQRITGESYGANFEQWQGWWLKTHSDTNIDWSSHLGFQPRGGGVRVEPKGHVSTIHKSN